MFFDKPVNFWFPPEDVNFFCSNKEHVLVGKFRALSQLADLVVDGLAVRRRSDGN